MTHSATSDSSRRFREVRRLFADAEALPDAEREAFVRARSSDEKVVQQVMALLASSADDQLQIERIVAAAAADVDRQDTAPLEQIDHYRLIERIGEGGMGQVYLAERDDDQFRHRVAIKILGTRRPGEELIRRFRVERQILARLQHPYIAQLHDGGATPDGLPYLVMEYVEGLPVDEYCEQHELNLSQRLSLFEKICESIDYAHRNLVVHRDIKPSNILITDDGDPKLLDFGIAKLIGDTPSDQTAALTKLGARALTLDYASPEQVRAEPITTATDVYSLGILLYRLLTGRSPYNTPSTSAHALEREICETDPEKPSLRAGDHAVPDLRKRLSGDLDAIVLKALRKEPQHRYPSPREMVDDIRRHRHHLPVEAHSGSWRYRAGKFLRRHAAGVAVGSAAVLMAGAFLAVTLQQNQRIQQERDAATRLADFMGELFYLASPEAVPGETVTVKQVLDSGQQRIQSELNDEPRTKARLLWIMGEAYTSLGLHQEAMPLITQSAELGLAGHLNDDDLVDVLANLGQEHSYLGNFDQATEYFETAERVFARMAAPPADLGTLLLKLHAMHLSRGNRTDAGLAKMLEAERLARTIENDVDNDHADVMHNLGTSYLARGDNTNAEHWLRRSLEKKGGDDINGCNRCAVTIGVLAIVLRNQDRPVEALEYSNLALDILTRVMGPEHVNVGITYSHIGHANLMLRNFDAAEAAYAQSNNILEMVLGPEHYRLGSNYGALSQLRVAQQRYRDADEFMQRSLAITTAALPPDHRLQAVAHMRAGVVARHLEDYPTAHAQLEVARNIYRTKGLTAGEAIVLTEIGITHHAAGDYTEAAAALTEALAFSDENDIRRASTAHQLGASLVSLGNCDKARPHLNQAYEMLAGDHNAVARAEVAALLTGCAD